MNKVYKFIVDTFHLSPEIDEMYDDFQTIDVMLSDEEVIELLNARESFYDREDYQKISEEEFDEEYWMYMYAPKILQKIRMALEQQAPGIWGEKIIPELDNVDFLLPENIDWETPDTFAVKNHIATDNKTRIRAEIDTKLSDAMSHVNISRQWCRKIRRHMFDFLDHITDDRILETAKVDMDDDKDIKPEDASLTLEWETADCLTYIVFEEDKYWYYLWMSQQTGYPTSGGYGDKMYDAPDAYQEYISWLDKIFVQSTYAGIVPPPSKEEQLLPDLYNSLYNAGLRQRDVMTVIVYVLNNDKEHVADVIDYAVGQKPTVQQLKAWLLDRYPDLKIAKEIDTCPDGFRIHLCSQPNLFGELKAAVSSPTDLVCFLPLNMTTGYLPESSRKEALEARMRAEHGSDYYLNDLENFLTAPYKRAKEVIVWVREEDDASKMLLYWASQFIPGSLSLAVTSFKTAHEDAFRNRRKLTEEETDKYAQIYDEMTHRPDNIRIHGDEPQEMRSVSADYYDEKILAFCKEPITVNKVCNEMMKKHKVNLDVTLYRLLALYKRGWLTLEEEHLPEGEMSLSMRLHGDESFDYRQTICLTEEAAKYKESYIFTFASASRFADEVLKRTRGGFQDIMFVMDLLPDLKLHEGYELDAFDCGEKYVSGKLQAYCHKLGSTTYFKETPYEAKERNIYDDSMMIHGYLRFGDARYIPSPLKYMDVPFTIQGILQAWLLENIGQFGVLEQHSLYGKEDYAFGIGSLLELLHKAEYYVPDSFDSVQEMRMNLDQLMPFIAISDDTAELGLTYWCNYGGLFRMTQRFRYVDNQLVFEEPECKNLVAYRSSITF